MKALWLKKISVFETQQLTSTTQIFTLPSLLHKKFDLLETFVNTNIVMGICSQRLVKSQYNYSLLQHDLYLIQ